MSKTKLPQPRETQSTKPKAAAWSRDKSTALRLAAKRRTNGACDCMCK